MGESGLVVAIQGTAGSNSHIALNSFSDFFGLNANAHSVNGFPELVDAMNPDSSIDFFLVPYINSTGGFIHQGLVGIVDNDLEIVGDEFLPVRHFLVKQQGNDDLPRTAWSHPEALKQCFPYLTEQGLEPKPYGNTALAAKDLGEGKIKGYAICSSLAASIYPGLEIIGEIPLQGINVTRFFFSKKKSAQTPPQLNRNVLDYRLNLVVDHSLGEGNLELLNVLQEWGIRLVQNYSIPKESENGRVFNSRTFLDFVFRVRDGYIHYKGRSGETNGEHLVDTGIPFKELYEMITAEEKIKILGMYEMHKLGDGTKPFRFKQKPTYGIHYAKSRNFPRVPDKMAEFRNHVWKLGKSAYSGISYP